MVILENLFISVIKSSFESQFTILRGLEKDMSMTDVVSDNFADVVDWEMLRRYW